MALDRSHIHLVGPPQRSYRLQFERGFLDRNLCPNQGHMSLPPYSTITGKIKCFCGVSISMLQGSSMKTQHRYSLMVVIWVDYYRERYFSRTVFENNKNVFFCVYQHQTVNHCVVYLVIFLSTFRQIKLN